MTGETYTRWLRETLEAKIAKLEDRCTSLQSQLDAMELLADTMAETIEDLIGDRADAAGLHEGLECATVPQQEHWLDSVSVGRAHPELN